VRTADSGDLRADLVIDAMGRRSPLPVWLAAIGAGQPAEETSQTPIAYYSRFFQAPAGEQPPPFRAPITTRFDGYTLIILPGDAGSWSVMIALSAHDQALKALREEANWAKLVSSCPLHANLIAGPPITGVVASGGNADRLRSLVVDAKPVATGILLVGDSWATTNPAVARGITLGLMHAAITAEAVTEHLADPYSLALEHDRLTRERLLPWYRGTVALDRQIFDQFTAVIEGRRPPRPGDPDGAIMRDLVFGLGRDPDIFRAYLEVISMLAQPQEIAARPGMAERIREAAAGGAPAAPPGPTRAEVLAMLS
jgi:2-polyprenyl-6-methoxyphenol hydroxylase-like FAD-dependent oxidoreductase